MKPKVVVILGPTATGKSNCGIKLAMRLKTEILSGDSMLVYRNMNIGTAKPSDTELASVPHHFVNILEPDENFNVFDFKLMAEKLILQLLMKKMSCVRNWKVLQMNMVMKRCTQD